MHGETFRFKDFDELVSQACDWGEAGSPDDNNPIDLNTTSTNYGDDANFVETMDSAR